MAKTTAQEVEKELNTEPSSPKAGKKYFLTLEEGIDAQKWGALLPNTQDIAAILVAGVRTEVSKEVFDYMNTEQNNPDIYNPQTKKYMKRFFSEIV